LAGRNKNAEAPLPMVKRYFDTNGMFEEPNILKIIIFFSQNKKQKTKNLCKEIK